MSARHYASKCIDAAEHSRLSPFALHPDEYLLFRDHITHAQVTTYLNMRNGMLRLWLLNPQTRLSREKAVGCAHWRWFDAASACYDWLVRRGYINFGSVRIPALAASSSASASALAHDQQRRKTVVVIGAGFSGLGCARQLDCLFRQYADEFEARGELPPRVIVLEGRTRVGGRVYSRAFSRDPDPSFAGQRPTAEMGGMIITGFERGNPLNILVRGQLGLSYHLLNPNMTLYDVNGRPVDAKRDRLVEHLYNDCLDRVSEFKFRNRPEKLIAGDSDLIEDGKDVGVSDDPAAAMTIAQAEKERAAEPDQPSESEQNVAGHVNLVPVSTDKVTGQIHTQPGEAGSATAAERARSFGWTLKPGVARTDNVDLGAAAQAPGATLGSVLDSTIAQCRGIVDLGPLDFRLLNWHIANLEYSNATTLNNLSLGGWDIDAGNEWDGAHSMVVGGYQSVARGLMMCPQPLDVRRQAAVTRIEYASGQGVGSATVTTDDGTTYEADCVVSTIPLGVMKAGAVEYDPPLPLDKTGAVERLGFGILNKVVLVYEKPFWPVDEDGSQEDIFGVLRMPPRPDSVEQDDYTAQRGRFFQWFNLTKPCGLPCLLALMAGDAGFATERTSNADLVQEATDVLRSVFGGPDKVPFPVEAIVTRWGSDPFARGSYSSCGPGMQPDDYDVLARPAGNLYFAGEHTIGTHPATVHGAYLSGLRVAGEVLDALVGPIRMPSPLLRPKDAVPTRGSGWATGGGGGNAAVGGSGGASVSHKRKQPPVQVQQQVVAVVSPPPSVSPSAAVAAAAVVERTIDPPPSTATNDYENELFEHIKKRIGERPAMPSPPPASLVVAGFNEFRAAKEDAVREARRKSQRTREKRDTPGSDEAMSDDNDDDLGGDGHDLDSSSDDTSDAAWAAEEKAVMAAIDDLWAAASADEREEFEAAARAQAAADARVAAEKHRAAAAHWDARAVEIRMAYERAHPPPPSPGDDDGPAAHGEYTLRVKSRRLLRRGAK
jgi:lysine-specific histone demethylase 1